MWIRSGGVDNLTYRSTWIYFKIIFLVFPRLCVIHGKEGRIEGNTELELELHHVLLNNI